MNLLSDGSSEHSFHRSRFHKTRHYSLRDAPMRIPWVRHPSIRHMLFQKSCLELQTLHRIYKNWSKFLHAGPRSSDSFALYMSEESASNRFAALGLCGKCQWLEYQTIAP